MRIQLVAACVVVIAACGGDPSLGPARPGVDAVDDGVEGSADVGLDVDAADAPAEQNDAVEDDATAPSDATDADSASDGSAAPDVAADVAEDSADALDATDGSGDVMSPDASDGGMDADPDAIAAVNIDLIPHGCVDFVYTPGPCLPPERATFECEARNHIADSTPIAYEEVPPACGPHRGQWARWGEYSYLPPQRYLHNLEHGGVAFLYHPCAPPEMVEQMRAFARSRAADEGGAFRWVMTPYPGLPTAIGLATWGQRYLADCFEPERAIDFIDVFYRQAPEDVGSDGAYGELWLNRGEE